MTEIRRQSNIDKEGKMKTRRQWGTGIIVIVWRYWRETMCLGEKDQAIDSRYGAKFIGKKQLLQLQRPH